MSSGVRNVIVVGGSYVGIVSLLVELQHCSLIC